MRIVKNLEKLGEILNTSDNIIIIGHYNPDGDCVGSTTGMYHYLKSIGNDSQIIIPSEIPHNLHFLNTTEREILIYEESKERCDKLFSEAGLIISLDFNTPSRVNLMQEALESSKATKILIDHHISPNEDFFDVIVSDTEVSSACELLYQILKGFVSTDALPIECCNSLFSGLLTDTNNFNNSIYPQTLNMAAELLARGVDRNYIYQNIFCSYSRSRVELMGMVLNQRLKFIHNGEVAYMLLSMKDKVDYSFQKGDSEGFVNIPLCIGDVKISAIFTEYEDQIRVSLRSKGDIDVNSFCRRYCNGGGHKNASGGKLLMPLECVGDYFERSINEFLGE